MRIRWSSLSNFMRNYRRVLLARKSAFYERFRPQMKFARPTMMLMFSGGFSFKDHGICNDDVQEINRGGIQKTVQQIDPENGWEPLVEERYLRVYRRRIDGQAKLYEYRCEGTYFDVSPRNFIDAQNDVEYRRKWDPNVLSLEIKAKDESSVCEVIRWIAKFPFPLYAREYIYVRRQAVDEENKTITVLSRALSDEEYPSPNQQYVRVKLYRSSLIVSAHSDFDQDGLDYTLTYCDNPEGNIPSSAYNWIINQGGPGFLKLVYTAAKELEATRTSRANSPASFVVTKFE